MASSASESDVGAPVIGVTTYLERSQTGVWDLPASFLPKVYLDAVTDAGGIAVLLPPQPVTPEIARRVLAGVDGLIVSGGADVDPRRYGQAPHERTGAPAPIGTPGRMRCSPRRSTRTCPSSGSAAARRC